MAQAIAGSSEHEAAFVPSAWVTILDGVAARVEGTRAIILIRGERGTGKEVMARLLHDASARRSHGFIKVTCAGSSDRVAQELFGHERNVIPGLGRRRLGRLEFANHGTLFLDEFDALPGALHPQLLRAVLDLEFCRIAAQRPISVDFRLIGATTRQLHATRGENGLREAGHRLTVVDLRLPPLRERPEDLGPLVSWFLAKFNRQYQRNIEVSAETFAALAQYPWPGNVRELEEVVERLVGEADDLWIRQELKYRLRQATARTEIPRGA
jgi:DNA-binding NtrC family response regulator